MYISEIFVGSNELTSVRDKIIKSFGQYVSSLALIAYQLYQQLTSSSIIQLINRLLNKLKQLINWPIVISFCLFLPAANESITWWKPAWGLFKQIIQLYRNDLWL